jgi:mRNA interferase YafQ
MRTIERSGQFKRDYKREMNGTRRSALPRALAEAVGLLASDSQLPDRYVDHALSGQLKGFRDLHIFPDLILLYEKPDRSTVRLVRLGSHSELGL